MTCSLTIPLEAIATNMEFPYVIARHWELAGAVCNVHDTPLVLVMMLFMEASADMTRLVPVEATATNRPFP